MMISSIAISEEYITKDEFEKIQNNVFNDIPFFPFRTFVSYDGILLAFYDKRDMQYNTACDTLKEECPNVYKIMKFLEERNVKIIMFTNPDNYFIEYDDLIERQFKKVRQTDGV